MIPSGFVMLDAMPLTPSGKIARRMLPIPDGSGTNIHHGGLPKTRGQRALADIWQRLLKVRQIQVEDNFFDLGGHSLLTIKLIQEIEKITGQRLTIANVFENPTIQELTVLLADADWPQTEQLSESVTASPWARLWSYIRGDSSR
jgi:aryl carrier-like protein